MAAYKYRALCPDGSYVTRSSYATYRYVVVAYNGNGKYMAEGFTSRHDLAEKKLRETQRNIEYHNFHYRHYPGFSPLSDPRILRLEVFDKVSRTYKEAN